jgi:Fur family ferric uptake transcriptional regulator
LKNQAGLDQIMRASSVRNVILEILGCDGCHLSAREILAAIRPRLPAVNSSTVYRSLDRLLAAGSISVSDIGTGAEVYEIVQQHAHHHVVCQNCGRMVVLDNAVVERFLDEAAQISQFEIKTNHLVLFGICTDCQPHPESM